MDSKKPSLLERIRQMDSDDDAADREGETLLHGVPRMKSASRRTGDED